ncbi:LysR family transcriptional regulator ArgP [Rhodococcus sp. NPDC058521]|uniref:LysR family transcriptional regulator ArgP n=1 Tax=Rhodococcus sp. NPDC058521 TaxID=3346536 RepID=UPI00364DBCA0
MDIEFSQLRTFAAVVDEGTFEAAAKILHVTPSAVSQRIKTLELQVGSVLVQRSKPVTLTAPGRVVMQLARQVARLEEDTAFALEPSASRVLTVPVVVNADSLSTWMIPALGVLAAERTILVELHRADEYHSTEMLRAGTVMAAVTSEPVAVQGCSVTKLGSMRYLPLCSPDYARRWFPDGESVDAFARAPMLVFDRKDDLQTRYLRKVTRRRMDPPRHYIPGSTAFAEAVRYGLGWGMLPEIQVAGPLASGDFVQLESAGPIDVPLHWQRWKLESPALGTVTEAVLAGARDALRAIGA